MSKNATTFIGEVQSVTGGLVSVKLREDLQSSLILVEGESYRVGQVGGFLRIPLGYYHLYGVCTQVGAAAVPVNAKIETEGGSRWLSLSLFGEALGQHFERGVSQYPTVGDEVHLVTPNDLRTIYGSTVSAASINVGTIAAASGIPARLDLQKLVSRHCAVVGSTGSGKSNLTSVILESIADQGFPSARILVIDPHGEFGSAVGDAGMVYRVTPEAASEKQLYVPFWAIACDEFIRIAMGDMATGAETAIRDLILDKRKAAAKNLKPPISDAMVNADSPIGFSAKHLWFDLDDFERHTIQDRTTGTRATLLAAGDPEQLTSNVYPPPAPGTAAPFVGQRRGLSRQLELMKSRLRDSRFSFLFDPGPEFTPDKNGTTQKDLGELVASWVGHDKPITVLDVSGSPPEVTSAVVGTLLRIIYDTLFWSGELPVSGRNQPLLVVLEEAHLFLPEGGETVAHRIVRRIAKEGRKYGVGLLVVTQRPSEIDSTVLSQCGTFIALRLSNNADQSKVSAAMPDDLGNLTSMLPSLRTGEALAIGEAVPIPSRIQFRRAKRKPVGDDPDIHSAWTKATRPDPKAYVTAVTSWRNQRRFKTK